MGKIALLSAGLSNSEVVELLRSGHVLFIGAVQLPLVHYVHGLDAGN